MLLAFAGLLQGCCCPQGVQVPQQVYEQAYEGINVVSLFSCAIVLIWFVEEPTYERIATSQRVPL